MKGIYTKGKTAETQGEQDFWAVFRSYKCAKWHKHCLGGTYDLKIQKGLISVQECREDKRGYVLGSSETRTYVSSKCTGCRGYNTGPEFRNLGGDLELDSGEYIEFGYKEVSGLGQV